MILFTPKTSQLYKPDHKVITPGSGKPFWRSFGIIKDITENQLDIFHGLSNELPYRIEKNKCKSVVSIHDVLFMRYPELYPYIDRKIYDLKTKFACSSADCIIAISEQSKKDLLEYYDVEPEKIKVVYQSCGKQYFDNNETASPNDVPKRYILTVGSLVGRKNHKTLIAALPMIDKDIELVIIGRGKLRSELEALSSELGVSKRVQFKDNVGNADLPSYYKASLAFVFPSLFEGFGIPILEAMLCRTPVIVGKNSCFPEVAGESSIYIDQHSPQDIADAVNMISNKPEKRLEIVERSYNFAQLNFHPNIVASKLHQLYEHLRK